MEQTKEKLEAEIALLNKAVETLNLALEEKLSDIVRDAVIQRFEYVFELAWKTIQTAARYTGLDCNSPREAIKLAFKAGWIKDADIWLESMKARNNTSHTYNLELANQVYEVAKKFPSIVQDLIRSLIKVS